MATGETGGRARVHGLPAENTSFVGRRRELAEVRRMLSDAPIVTLTGPGGVGKTRLALRVAAVVHRAFPDGVWLVDLSSVRHRDLVARSIAEALGLRDNSARPALDMLTGHLCDRRALVVLDNCEHLVDECAAVAGAILRSASRLRILATSRHSLGILGERLLEVPPLALPDDAAARAPTRLLQRSDAVRLFAERGAAAAPGFAVTMASMGVVAEICRRLDGIPLGIELAAARLRTLPIDQLLIQLEDRFRLLVGDGEVVPRHRTLRALIDWSHDLCTVKERLLWSRLSIFAGSVDLEAAEAVCAGEGIERHEVVDLMIGLVDKSILIPRRNGPVVRYRLLETVREYGRERLERAGRAPAFRRRHHDHYRRLAGETRARMSGPDQRSWLARLEAEHANLRVALEYGYTEAGEAQAGLAMAADLMYHWIHGVYLAEGRGWLERGLAMETRPSGARLHALWTTGVLAVIQGDARGAETILRECRSLGELLGDPAALAYAALCAGMLALAREDAESAIPLLEEVVSRQRSIGDHTGAVEGLIRLCAAHSIAGDEALAIAVGEESLAMCRRHGERWHQAYTLTVLGAAVFRQGDLPRASALVSEAVRLNRSLDDPRGVGLSLEVLTLIAAAQGRFGRAARSYGILHSIWDMVGGRPLSGYMHPVAHGEESELRVRRALGESAFQAEYRRGAALDYDEALEYVLGERRSPAASPGDRLPPLTPRESQVARLIARGLSDKEIAASLVIAPRTAEAHAQRILTRLGFDSRARIAVWVTERDQRG
ncbi:ATP-binding protein [Actinoallomurus sp. CA-150999]|uniref:ATP-binding protein n=1 Tax=Actinoallomurus sp. CA-150999 TaxID=3239887 RepID=UPI003D909B37